MEFRLPSPEDAEKLAKYQIYARNALRMRNNEVTDADSTSSVELTAQRPKSLLQAAFARQVANLKNLKKMSEGEARKYLTDKLSS